MRPGRGVCGLQHGSPGAQRHSQAKIMGPCLALPSTLDTAEQPQVDQFTLPCPLSRQPGQVFFLTQLSAATRDQGSKHIPSHRIASPEGHHASCIAPLLACISIDSPGVNCICSAPLLFPRRCLLFRPSLSVCACDTLCLSLLIPHPSNLDSVPGLTSASYLPSSLEDGNHLVGSAFKFSLPSQIECLHLSSQKAARQTQIRDISATSILTPRLDTNPHPRSFTYHRLDFE